MQAGNMTLTGHELEILPSIVAVIAIVGGYLGVRSANGNALRIAREERGTKRQDELNALKRAVYVRHMQNLTQLYRSAIAVTITTSPNIARVTALSAKLNASLDCAHTSAEIQLLAPLIIRTLSTEAYNCVSNATADSMKAVVRSLAKLSATMRDDLEGKPFSTPDELDRMVDKSPGMQADS
jgi:hypothetical protein